MFDGGLGVTRGGTHDRSSDNGELFRLDDSEGDVAMGDKGGD